MNEHVTYIDNLKSTFKQLESDLTKSRQVSTMLEDIMDWLATLTEDNKDLSKKDFNQVCSMLKSYAHARNAHKATVDQYIKVTNEWAKATGIEAHHSAAAARIKEAERLRGKDDAGRDPLVKTDQGDEECKKVNDPFFEMS